MTPDRFLDPTFTTPARMLIADVRDLPEVPELPEFHNPAASDVVEDSGIPLVPLAHRRVRVLSNYWHAGWNMASPSTLLREDALVQLGTAADSLPDGFGLAVFDAWRPLALQAELYDAAYGVPGLPEGYVAEPIADPRTPPPHVTGGVVDLTLTFDGIPLALGTGFDDFTPRAAAGALEDEPGVERQLRRLLYHTMHDAGFVVLDCEWWHYEFGTRRWAAITGHEPRYGPAAPPAELIAGADT